MYLDTRSPQSSMMMMERILLGVLYLTGCHIFPTCPLHQYHYINEPMIWTEAQSYCRETYTDLATIENADEVTELRNTAPSGTSAVWIGLYSEIDWRWSDNYTGEGAEYRKWEATQPEFFNDMEFCVAISNVGWWWDLSCSESHPFICNNGTQLDPEFIFVGEAKTWSGAQRYCRENFFDLATVRKNNESAAVHSLVPSGSAWIGLFRDPNIYWSDGSEYSYGYWNNGENLIRSEVVCGAAVLQSFGAWMFYPCETRFPFVCHGPPREVNRQVVKLKIKPGASSVDLNALKADMLKKLQDRLKEQGVDGVTLKWREQPDGKVFHKEKKEKKVEKKENKCEL